MRDSRSESKLTRAQGWFDWFFAQWRYGLIGVIVAAGTFAFMCITTTEQPERPATLLEAIYWSIGLFVLQTNGFPLAGPKACILLAWLLYFFAPLVSLSAFIETVQRVRHVFLSPDRLVRSMRNHFIICGFGKHGRMVLEGLLNQFPDEQAVIIDNDPSLGDFVYFNEQQRLPVLRADLHYDPARALRRAQISKAKEIVAATGDDVLNAGICVAAVGEPTIPGFKCIAMAGDLELTAGLQSILKKLDGERPIQLLNTYEIAAEALLDRLVDDPSGSPVERGLLVLGFGRFGSMLVKTALDRWPVVPRSPWIVVVDLAAKVKLRRLDRQPQTTSAAVVGLDGSIDEPEVIDRAISALANGTNSNPLIVLCTDSDTSNLRTALHLRRFLSGDPVVLTRMFEPPPRHLDLLLSEHRIQCFELRDLISSRLEF